MAFWPTVRVALVCPPLDAGEMRKRLVCEQAALAAVRSVHALAAQKRPHNALTFEP